MNNLEIYSKVSEVPKTAQKTIGAGRLKGMTDINPMWRIKMLTEIFGVCGIGWKYTITDKRIVEGADGAMCAFVDVDLFVKVGGEWSDAIPGTGGSQFVSLEKNGKYTNDECFKMALTDALSVACKALGFGADIYWSNGRTKYSGNAENPGNEKTFAPVVNIPTYDQALDVQYNGKALRDIYKEDRKAIPAIFDSPDTPAEIKEAIRVIQRELDKMKAAK